MSQHFCLERNRLFKHDTATYSLRAYKLSIINNEHRSIFSNHDKRNQERHITFNAITYTIPSLLIFYNYKFLGDTLFAGGCGRFFEGTKEQMYRALVEVLQKLPGNTVTNFTAYPGPLMCCEEFVTLYMNQLHL